MNNLFESICEQAHEKVKECLREIEFPAAHIKKATLTNEKLEYDGIDGDYTYTIHYTLDLKQDHEEDFLRVVFRLYSDLIFSDHQHFEFSIGVPDLKTVLVTDDDMRSLAEIIGKRGMTVGLAKSMIRTAKIGKKARPHDM